MRGGILLRYPTLPCTHIKVAHELDLAEGLQGGFVNCREGEKIE